MYNLWFFNCKMISICALLEIENLAIIWLMLIFICFKLHGSVGKVEVNFSAT
jgi:hypothetical protein